MQFSFTKGGRQYSYMDWRSEVQQIERSYQFSLESVQWFNGSMVQWFNGWMDGWMDGCILLEVISVALTLGTLSKSTKADGCVWGGSFSKFIFSS